MPFVKVVKNRAYFKRFQVKYRRRREGKTDYRARRLMVLQDKTKYGAAKYRLVVRITNRDVIVQVVQAKMKGDEVVCAAYSHELPAFGIQFGLTNYAAAYCTGLLCARRVLTKLKIAEKFEGVKEATGAFTASRTKADDGGDSQKRFPFKAILDVGLARTTTGARVFGAMKGAVDGGLAVPHKPNRFPGFNAKKKELNAKLHRGRIFGKHVADYMKRVADEKKANPDSVITTFGKMSTAVAPEKLEEMYKKAHEAIRQRPMGTLPRKEKPANARSKSYKVKKMNRVQKKVQAKKKIAALRVRLGK